MGTYTTRLALFIPAGSDKADVQTIIDAWEILDTTSGMIICTEATKPTTNLFPGTFIRCSDSGKHYFYGGGSWAGTPPVYSGGTWTEDYYVTAVTPVGGDVFYGAEANTGWAFALFNSGSTPHDTYSGVAPLSVPVANANQRVKYEVNIDWICDNGVNANAWPTTVYLTIDGVDKLLGRLDANGSTSTVYTSKRFTHFETHGAAATHNVSIKMVGGANNGTSASIITVNRICHTATLSQ